MDSPIYFVIMGVLLVGVIVAYVVIKKKQG
jgi:LPXTG-motif cell wall-anchored protein